MARQSSDPAENEAVKAVGTALATGLASFGAWLTGVAYPTVIAFGEAVRSAARTEYEKAGKPYGEGDEAVLRWWGEPLPRTRLIQPPEA